MATTTNYSWSTPDDTALVKDGAAAIRSLGTAIDTTVFNNANAAIAKTLIDAKGDLIVGSAADTAARLAVGTNGHVLTADSAATNGVKWAAASGGGKVLQILSTTKTDTYVQSSGGWTDITGFSVQITPSANTSKILVLVSLSASGASAANTSAARLVRDSTDIFIGDTASNRQRVTIPLLQGETQYPYSSHISFLDSPATTSQLTYKVSVIGLPTGGAVYVNRGQTDTDSSTFTRSASSITVLEIGA